MGANIRETEDGLLIQESRLKGAELQSYDDHRLAMALSVAGFAAEGDTVIHNCSCIKKSYPNFIADMQNLGAKIKIEE